jgi:Rieske Fe-S protein
MHGSELAMPQLAASVLTAALLAATGACFAGASAQELPKRKPGLWQQSMTMAGARAPASSVTMCTDEHMDKMLMQRSEGAERCTQQSVRREGNAVLFDAVCTHQGSTVRTKGRFTGDFNSRYSGAMHSTFDPPINGMKEMRQQVEARWLGPCKPGQKPGDVFVEGMGAVNVQEMMQGMDPNQMQEVMRQMEQMKQRAKPQ